MSHFNCRAEVLLIALGAGVVALGLGVLGGVGGVGSRGGEVVENVALVQPEGEMDAMMETFIKSSQPGEQHERLGYFVGEWKAVSKFWMPGQEPMVSEGTSTTKWVLGNRYLQTDFHLDDMMGKPFDGIGFMAYDNNTSEFESSWMDSWSTGIYKETGSYSSSEDTYTLSGTGSSPFGPMKMKHITKIIDKNTHVLEFWEPDPETGEFVRSGEITYTRK